jgi:AcrR family transcriptional regulator
MARVVKEPEVRREEIVATAMSLFAREGFERTSIDRITNEIGVAKGTFYHYFDSKQDLLVAVATTWADELFTRLEEQLAQVEGDAPTRLRAFFSLASNFKLEQREETLSLSESLYRDENIRVRTALMAGWLERVDRTLTGILAEGKDEGLFVIGEPAATATVLTSMWFGWGDRMAPRFIAFAQHPDAQAAARLKADIDEVETGMERILGMEAGTLGLHLGGYLDAWTGTE